MNTNDVEDLPIQGDPSGHEDERSVEGPETKHSIISSEIDSFFAQFAPNQRYHPIFDKFGPEHVSQFLEGAYLLESAESTFCVSGRFPFP